MTRLTTSTATHVVMVSLRVGQTTFFDLDLGLFKERNQFLDFPDRTGRCLHSLLFSSFLAFLFGHNFLSQIIERAAGPCPFGQGPETPAF